HMAKVDLVTGHVTKFYYGNEHTTTIALFPGDMSRFSPATCRWGKVSPATCRWRILAGEAS
ncbi:hypothetical protein Tco_0544352, partial [Tanacetum coccineum]